MRLAAVIVLTFAAVMLLAGSLTSPWGRAKSDDYVSIRWGLTDVTYCESEGLFLRSCKTRTLSEQGWDQGSIAIGRATFAAGVVATLAAIALAVLAWFESKGTRVAAGVSLTTGASALLGAALFIIFLPDEATDLDPELGSSFYLYVLGCVTALVGSSMATRSLPRKQATDDAHTIELPPHLQEAAMPGAPRGAMPSPVPIPPPPVEVPTCQQCGGHGVWIHETRHFACVRCNVYLT